MSDPDDLLLAVGDGVTRHPQGAVYPDPSPATRAAEAFCRAARDVSYHDPLRTVFARANRAIAGLNEVLGLGAAQGAHADLAGTVGAIARCQGNVLEWAYIADSGVAVVGCSGGVEWETPDDLAPLRRRRFSEFEKLTRAERHVAIRDRFRNRVAPSAEGFGVLTGEPEALGYVRTGARRLSGGEVVLVFSDGFRPFLRDRRVWGRIGAWAGGGCAAAEWHAELNRLRRHAPSRFRDEATVLSLSRNA